MKTFAELFKKYRLRAEFGTISSFSDALSEKGIFFEESIFSHWQKGTRIPTDRKLVLIIIEVFVQRRAITKREEANEFLSSTGLGYLSEQEEKKFALIIEKSSNLSTSHFNLLSIALLIFLSIVSVIFVY